MSRILTIILLMVLSLTTSVADDTYYSKWEMDVTDAEGTTYQEWDRSKAFQGSAPITVYLTVTTDDGSGHEDTNVVCTGQWRVWKKDEGSISSPKYSRIDNPTQFTFNDGGTYYIAYVGTVKGDHVNDEYTENEAFNLKYTVQPATSVLTFPNAFSPNGDGYNDVYKAKEVKSIVSFHATIYSRWGQRLYQWDDPYSGWDGTFNGRNVKDGVYYVQVKAKGADGTEYDIKKDVNLMRGYIDNSLNNY